VCLGVIARGWLGVVCGEGGGGLLCVVVWRGLGEGGEL